MTFKVTFKQRSEGAKCTTWSPEGRGIWAEETGGTGLMCLRNSKYVVNWCLGDGREKEMRRER